MRKILFFFLPAFLCSIMSMAQGLVVSGQVMADSAAPISGVSVVVDETKQGTSTDANGNFRIAVTGNRTSVNLTVSYVGYRPQTIRNVGSRPVTVQLQRDQTSFDDVVVVGYSTVRRKDLTGSVSSVNAKQLKDIPITNAAEALTGRLAGVQVTTSEGAPGAEVVIRVRGGGSITQDNSPIYIVDGVQVENALQVLSPQDIASIDVLKDASTTAIYGARGANGVVIITTKSGRPGKTQINYNGSAGFREIFKKMDVFNPYDFVQWQYERSLLTNDTSFRRIYGSTYDTLENYKNTPHLDWQEQVFGRKAGYQNHNLSVGGGSQTTTFNLSLTANREDGILIESGFERYLLNFKIDHRANDKLRFGLITRYIDQTIKGAGTSTSGSRTTNRLRHAIQYRPFEIPTVPGVDVFDEDYYRLSAGISNPVILTQAEYRRAFTKGINFSGYASYKLLRDLTFKSTIGYDNTATRQNGFSGAITSTARNFNQQPVVTINQQVANTFNLANTLQYQRNGIGKKHDVEVLLGQEIYQTTGNSNFMEVRFFPAQITPDEAFGRLSLGVPPAGSTLQQPLPTSNVLPPNRIFSLFGRVNYQFDKKIITTLTVRADRSTKFLYDKGLLVFPSGTVAYRFSQENFMKGIRFINDAKLRLGFGTAGNNRIGDLLYLQLYGVTGQYALNHAIQTGYAPVSLANPNLQWERNVSRNIGLDLSFLNSKINLTVDAYKNSGNDLLLSVAIPPTLGYTSQIQNVGSTSNRGIEFQLSANPVQTKYFSWNSTFNLSFNRNRVESLGPVQQLTRSAGWQGSDGADDYLVKVGQPVGLMYGFVNDGWYTVDDFDYNAATGAYTLKAGIPSSQTLAGTIRPGSMKIKDINGDGLITTDGDRTVIGNANPNYIGGWNNQFTYKNFDMSVFLNWVVGNDIYNANKIEWTDGTFANLNMLSIMKNRWTNIDGQGNRVTDPDQLTKLNANAQIWSPNMGQRYFLTSWAIEDGSFLRVNNITLGYTIPAKALRAVKIAGIRAFATVNNLATITNYTGYDPEVNTRRNDPLTPGVDFAGYPRAKTWVFGVNVNF